MTAKEKEKREEGIKARAKKVYDASFDYHLAHAVFGGDRLLMTDLKEANKQTVAGLNAELKVAVLDKNAALVSELMDKIKGFERTLEKRKHQILIDYIRMDDLYGGRVIKVGEKMIITLPREILANIMDGDRKLQKEPVENVREKMAHELGHIVLHADLVPKDDMAGTHKLGTEMDLEAEVFAKELLSLYKKRDHRIDN